MLSGYGSSRPALPYLETQPLTLCHDLVFAIPYHAMPCRAVPCPLLSIGCATSRLTKALVGRGGETRDIFGGVLACRVGWVPF